MYRIAATLLSTLILFSSLSSPAFAKITRVEHIPNWFSLYAVTDVDLTENFSLDEYKKIAIELKATDKVEQLDIAFYDKGRKTGDGIRGYLFFSRSEYSKGRIIDTWIDKAPSAERFQEALMCYSSKPEEFYKIYAGNPFIAADFTGKPVTLSWINAPRIQQDSSGKFFFDLINITGEFRIYLQEDDPFLRYVIQDSKISLKIVPLQMERRTIIANGEILNMEGKKELFEKKWAPKAQTENAQNVEQ